jgi:hypothetical protein
MHTPLLGFFASAQDAEDASGTDGTVTAVDPTQVVDLLAKFSGNDLTATLSRIERSVLGLITLGTRSFLLEATATNEVLMAATEVKRLAGQINVVIHSCSACHISSKSESKLKRFLLAQESRKHRTRV